MGWLWDKSESKKAEFREDTVRKLDLALERLADERASTDALRVEVRELRSEVAAMREELRDFLRRQGGDAIQEGLEAILSYGPKGGERR